MHDGLVSISSEVICTTNRARPFSQVDDMCEQAAMLFAAPTKASLLLELKLALHKWELLKQFHSLAV